MSESFFEISTKKGSMEGFISKQHQPCPEGWPGQERIKWETADEKQHTYTFSSWALCKLHVPKHSLALICNLAWCLGQGPSYNTSRLVMITWHVCCSDVLIIWQPDGLAAALWQKFKKNGPSERPSKCVRKVWEAKHCLHRGLLITEAQWNSRGGRTDISRNPRGCVRTCEWVLQQFWGFILR